MDHPTKEARVALPVWGGRDVLLPDYEATTALYEKLVDVRFKLLGFVPTVTAIAIGIISLDRPQRMNAGSQLAVGVVGLAATLAIVVYEIRNSQIHDRAVHRLKHLERLIGFTPSEPAPSRQGMFNERGKGGLFFGLVLIKHDRALAIIYGVVAAAWTWVVATSLITTMGWHSVDRPWRVVLGVGAPAVAGLAVALEVSRQGGIGRPPSLVYELSKLAASMRDGADPVSKGRRIFEQLNALRQKVKDERLTLHDLANEFNNDLVQLALAISAIEDHQRWSFWLWCLPSQRDECRNRRLLVQILDREEICIRCGVVGAHEVDTAMLTDPDNIEGTARDMLNLRYGEGAPWATSDEIALRRGLLEAAASAQSSVSSCR